MELSESPAALLLAQRRLKRAQRREKQRAENAQRALQMRKVRRAIEPVDSDSPLAPPPLPVVNVGCSGWYYWHWKGLFYPEDLAGHKWFSHYRQNFSTVELNAPFYSWPTASAVQGWTRQAGTDPFVYTVKVCELITHVKRFRGTRLLIKDFQWIAQSLGRRMGCFLFQLPPSFHFTAARLRAIVSQLDHTHRNVVEFRHASWWNPAVYEAFTQAGIIFCSCSAPRLPDELVVTAPDLYVRFHGVARWYRHDYARAELAEWVRRIRSSGAQRIWAYFNNDRDAHAIHNARLFRSLLGTKPFRPHSSPSKATKGSRA